MMLGAVFKRPSNTANPNPQSARQMRNSNFSYSLNYTAAYTLPGDNKPHELYFDQQMSIDDDKKKD
jgi:hypothetical protein